MTQYSPNLASVSATKCYNDVPTTSLPSSKIQVYLHLKKKHLKVVTQRIPCSLGNFHVCNSCGKNFYVGLHLERVGGVAFSPLGAYKSRVHYQYM